MLDKIRSVSLLLVFTTLVVAVAAQTGTSRLSGTVFDPNGEAVPGASVTLQNDVTGVTYKQVTTSEGIYSFASLPAGTYTITIEVAGFRKTVRSGNILEVNTPLSADVTLEVGAVTETVNVQAGSETIQSNTATVGNVVDQRSIEGLPLNGRNPLTLVLLEPGIVQRSQGAAGSGVHVNGSRDRAFNVTVDGIEANESSVPNPVSNLFRLNPDNVQEFKVTTNNATAEEGRNSGASITLSTRTGTNSLRGSLFYFHRNDALNTTEFFANALGTEKSTIKMHQYGFELSGPIARSKTFFFGSYQGNTIKTTQPVDESFGIPILYTGLAKQGLFRYFKPDPANPLVIGGTTITQNSPLLVDAATGALRSDVPLCATATQLRCVATFNVFSLGAANSFVTSYMNALPLPNSFGFGDGLNTAAYLWNPPTEFRGPAINVRIDHNFNDENSVFGRFLFSDYDTLKGDPLNSRPQVLPGFPPLGEVFRRSSNLALGFRRVFTPRIVNDLRLGYARFNFNFTQGEANPAFPDILPVDFNLISEPVNNTPRTQRAITTPQILDNLSIVKGSHVIGAGFNFRFYRHVDRRGLPGGVNLTPQISLSATTRPFPGFTNPAGINTTDAANLRSTINNLLGIPAQISQTFIGNLNDDAFLAFSSNGIVTLFAEKHILDQYNFYLQDEWRVRPNLTLNLGARWEINPAPHTANDQTYVAATPILAGPTTFVQADSWFKNSSSVGVIGPSLGLVWSPDPDSGSLRSFFGGANRSAIRLGYRIAFDTISSFQVTAAAGRIPGLLVTCSSTVGAATTPGCAAAPDVRLGQGFPQQLAPPTTRPSSFLNLPVQIRGNAPPITVFAPEMKVPTVHQWSLSWQRELPLGMVMQLAYIGRRGVHLYYAGDRNQINADRILPSFLIMQQNVARGCTPNGTGCPAGVTGTAVPIVQQGFATAAFVNSATTLTDLARNGAGNFAGRLDNTTAALPLGLRPNMQFSTITYLDNAGDSNYNAFQFTLRRRFTSGLGFGFAYTFGKSIDNQSVDPVGSASGGGLSTTNSRTPVDMRNLQNERGRSDFDRTHTTYLTSVWEVPVGRGRRFLNDLPGWANQILGGWTINGVSTFMTGEPFSLRSGVFTSNASHHSRAVVLDPSVRAQLQQVPGVIGPSLFANTNAFAIPLPGENGAGRNTFVAPSYYNLDMSFVKFFPITERFRLQLRTEVFNILNHPNFDNPVSASVGTPNIILPADFGRTCCQTVAPPAAQTVIQTGESARIIQFALKLQF